MSALLLRNLTFIASCLAVAFAMSFAASKALGDEIRYNRDVRPILADNCFSCHGPDSASRKADLRLDQFAAATESNAIVPGDVEASELVVRIRLPETDDLAMPPNTGHKRLSETQRKILEDWITQGAKYEQHWSLIPPTKPELPETSNPGWARNTIDHLILASLDAAGLKPAPEADRRTIARRLSLDITGLPPDPESVEAFVADQSPDYYERYVDSLLESTRYGEHRGRHWLDYARYGDTHGIHFDNYREMWSYRDWVINAFNLNMPFDQFTIEQLAGDMLPNATLDQKIASGFNRCNITTNEGGIIDEEYKVLYARDRTETTSTVWMGLTTGCAVCHDHKFDPISMKDFYSLSAFFNNTTQAVRDGNIANTPPVVPVPILEDRARFEELTTLLTESRSHVESTKAAARKEFDANPKPIHSADLYRAIPTDGLRFHALLNEGTGTAISSINDGKLQLQLASEPLTWGEGNAAPSAMMLNGKSNIDSAFASSSLEHDKPFSYGAWVYLQNDNTSGAIVAKMLDGADFRGFDLWLEGNQIGAHVIHKWPDNGIKVMTKKALEKNKWHHVFITYDGKGSTSGLQIFVNGEARNDRNESDKKLTDTIQNDQPLRIGGRSRGTPPENVRINDLRIYDRQITATEIAEIKDGSRIGFLSQKAQDKRSTEEQSELFAFWLNRSVPAYKDAVAELATLESEDKAIRDRGTIAHIMTERPEPAQAFTLERGEYDLQRDKVGAEVPEVLPPMATDMPRNRLGLAQWLVSPEHPLTARVTVNRFWQEIFGSGLVASSGDFGVTGELPSHPQLLDWLAIEFQSTDWDVKQLIRLFVTSATYRQAAVTTAEKIAIDPSNRLLSRGPRFRMDAEMVRDYALAVSGLLSPRIGGASVKPYQPEGVWEAVAMTPSNTRFYKQDSGESLYRRSMYTFWKRSAPPASMDVFNAPSREVCTVRRERTNTPLQALAMLNDPQMVEAARHLATHVMQASSEVDARIDTMARRILARPLEEREVAILVRSLEALIQHYSNHADEAAKLVDVGDSPTPTDLPENDLAAYTMLANQLLNIDEVVNK
jgi:hypothetical protein